MIDISQETLIALRDAPRQLPARPNGKRLHISACYRWISRGVRGVRLESIRIGGTTYTSLEALQRFGDRLAQADRNVIPNSAPLKAREREIARASQAVRAALGLPAEKRASNSTIELSRRVNGQPNSPD